MWQKLMFIFFILIFVASVTTKTARKQDRRNNGISPMHAGTSFDYDYGIQSRRAPGKYHKSNPTTTERPLIRYWNNFVRNVRLPVPTITWNMTTPLVNLFNPGGTNVIESPVGDYYTGPTRKRKNTHRHSNIVVERTKKRKRPQHNHIDEEILQVPTPVDERPQILLEPYTFDFNPSNAVYFYDPSIGQYYQMQRFQSQYIAQNYQQEEAKPVPQKADEINNNVVPEEEEEEVIENPKQNKTSYAYDDDVAVVSKLDDDDSEESKISNEENSTQNNEHLRSVFGSHMNDDRFNRQRQRANPKRKVSKRIVIKPRPSNPVRYYFLKAV